MTDMLVEAQPLWEYPNVALGSPQTVCEIDFGAEINDTETTTAIPIET